MSTAARSPTPAEQRMRCGVLGRPVSHSLSPVLHRAAYAALGLDWEYDAHDIGEDELSGFLDGLDQTWRGLSLTMPLKRVVLDLIDEVSDTAGRVGAANTVLLEGGRRTGHNTDVPGAVAAIGERWSEPVRSAVLVGGGATAASMLHALAELGCGEVTVVVRDESRAADTLAAARRHPRVPELDVRLFGMPQPETDALVSTIPAAAQTSQVTSLASGARLVFDVAYDPWPTPLARTATGHQQTLVTGLDLLVHQAVRQVELMTGVRTAPLEVMRGAGFRRLGP